MDFLGQPKTEQKEVQDEVTTIVSSPPPQIPAPSKMEPDQPETIPFAPLPDPPPSLPPKELTTKPSNQPVPVVEEVSSPVDTKTQGLGDSFGLICTKFEKVPSRFRLVSWDSAKKVELEDLSKISPSTKKHPKFWIRVRVPYKELIHPTSRESFFRPTTLNDPNKRLIAHSFEIKSEAFDYSSRLNPVGYLILRDFKIGGPPYQMTSKMEEPLTSSYYLHFEQNMGPQKFFHDLTGKRNGHTFGGWGFQYRITKQNFSQNKITVLRKELNTGKLMEKELSGPTSL